MSKQIKEAAMKEEKQGQEPEIKVAHIERMNNGSALLAFVDIEAGPFLIRGFRLLKKGDGSLYVDLPRVSWRSRAGFMQYKSLLSIPGSLKQGIDLAIFRAWKEGKEHERPST